MINDQFLEINEIIENANKDIYAEVEECKQAVEEILNNALNSVCHHYNGIAKYTIYGADSYLFNTSYEQDSAIKYYVSVSLIDNNGLSLKHFIKPQKKRKKRKSTRQQLMENISGISSEKVPYIQDFTSYFAKELSFLTECKQIINNNCSIAFLFQNQQVELVVCYELEASILSYQKGLKSYNINIYNLYNNIYEKEKNTNSYYSKMCKFFKALEKEIVYAGISDIYISKKPDLVENLIYNVPNNLFVGDYKSCFLKVCSYLINCSFNDFTTIDGALMFDELEFKKKIAKNFVRKVMYGYLHFDEIIEKIMNDLDNQNIEPEDNLSKKQEIIENEDVKSNKTNAYQDFKEKLKNNRDNDNKDI